MLTKGVKMDKLTEFVKTYSWLFYVASICAISLYIFHLVIVKIILPSIAYPIIHLFSLFGDKLL